MDHPAKKNVIWKTHVHLQKKMQMFLKYKIYYPTQNSNPGPHWIGYNRYFKDVKC